ncbi:MAG TPA: bacterioferritin [Candidatus Binatia bacterium]|jgi:bacterioferritin|nr:bacterioferritin [Candidatus Binatia bacterium]
MKGSKKVIDALNDILGGELVGINQYFLHSRMCKNWGFDRIAEVDYKESIGEMKHADELVERILFLDGIPNLQKLGKINVGETVPEQLKFDLALEVEAIGKLNQAIALCVAEGDNASRHLLEELLKSEEEHLDWLETQLGLIAKLGENQYLAEQMHD